MSIARRIFLVLMLVVFAVGTYGAIYARSQGFTDSWRGLVEQEFAKRGYHVEVTKLTLGPFRGLVAEDVRFFLDEEKKREYGSVDRIILDLDFSRIIDKELSLNMLEIREARLALPLDPEMNEDSESLKIRGISARIVVTESQIEVVDAEANIGGVDLDLKGIMTRPLGGDDDEEKTEDEIREERRRQTELLRQQRSSLANILERLKKVKYLTDERPKIEVTFYGDVQDFSSINAEIVGHASQFKHGPYTCRDAEIALSYSGVTGLATLEELRITDDQGDLRLQGEWTKGEREIEFSAESSADLSKLVRAFSRDNPLQEVVFFQSPRWKLEGKYRLGEKVDDGERGAGSLELIGEFLSDRFGSRGEVFEGMQCDFSHSDGKTYVRNLRLDHKSGVAWLNALYQPEDFRYEAEIKLDPRVFTPFFQEDGTRKFLSRWDFDDQSTVYVALKGSGPSLNAESWHSTGKLDLRNCRFNDVPFERMEADLEFDGPEQYYRNVRITRPEGEAESPEMFFNAEAKRWRIDQLRWNLDHIGATRAINPKLSNHLAGYGFSVPPTIIFDGEVDGRTDIELAEEDGLRSHNFTVDFASPEPANYEFLGRTLPLENPRGELRITGDVFHLERFAAELFGGEIEAEFQIAAAGEEKDQFGANVLLRDIPFDRVSDLYSDYKDTKGAISGAANFYGKIGAIETINGEGVMKIEDGDVFAIPLFGPLSKAAQGVLPNTRAGYSVAREAAATFRMEEGVLSTDDLEALAHAFRFKGEGEVNCATGEVSFDASFNTKFGLTAALLSPISKLMEYECDGTVSDPNWRPKAFNVPRKLISGARNVGEKITGVDETPSMEGPPERLRLKLPKIGEFFRSRNAERAATVAD